MIQRCHRANSVSYKGYGGRGTWVCLRWLESIANFIEDMGRRPPGMTLDRKDPFKNYTPDNCRWADRWTQANNKRAKHEKCDGPGGVVFDENTGQEF
jgi:hypothetical protein